MGKETARADRGKTPAVKYAVAVLAVICTVFAAGEAFALPQPPTSVSATALDEDRIRLNIHNIFDFGGVYDIYRSLYYSNDPSQKGTLIASVNCAYSHNVDWTNNGLNPGTHYYYRVYSRDTSGQSPTWRTADAQTDPSAPAWATSDGLNEDEIKIEWNPATGATRYKVCSGTVDSPGPEIDTTSHTYYTDNNLNPGTRYYYWIYSLRDSAGGESDTAVSTNTRTCPTKPTGISSDGLNEHTIEIEWNPATGATGYYVWRENSDDSWTPLPAASISGTTCTNTGLTPGTHYYYRVSSYNSSGSSTYFAYTNTWTCPSAPAWATATARDEHKIYVDWPSVTGATEYYVYRITYPSIGPPVETCLTFSPGISYSYYLDSGLEPGTGYSYRIRSHNSSGFSDSSAYSNYATTFSPLSPPDSATLEAIASDNYTINISWSSVSQATGYDVYRQYTTGSWGLIKSNISETTCEDTSLTPGRHYYYKVYSRNSSGQSATCASTDTWTLTAPSGPTATAISSSSITLAWGQVNGATGYRIDRSTSQSGPWTTIKPNESDPGYDDSPLTKYTRYYYRIYAKTSLGESNTYAACNAQTWNVHPAAPLFVNPPYYNTTNRYITISWNASNTTNEDRFEIDRGEGTPTQWEDAGETDPNVHIFYDSDILPTHTYKYAVRAHSPGTGGGNSGWVYSDNVTVPQWPCEAVDGLEATNIGANEITLEWVPLQNATGYRLKYTTDDPNKPGQPDESNWITRNTTSQGTYTQHSLTKDTLYYFKIAGYNSLGTGPFTSNLEVWTLDEPPVAPSGLTVSQHDSIPYAMILNWIDRSDNEDGFRVYRSNNPTGPFNYRVDNIADNDLNYNPEYSNDPHYYPVQGGPNGIGDLISFPDKDHTMTGSTTYYYRVYARNDAGENYAQASGTTSPAPPVAPFGVTTYSDYSDTSGLYVELHWQWVNTPGGIPVDGFKIKRAKVSTWLFEPPPDSQFIEVQTVPHSYSRQWYDFDVDPLSFYWYKVGAFSDEVPGVNYSAAAMVWTLDGPPAAPTWRDGGGLQQVGNLADPQNDAALRTPTILVDWDVGVNNNETECYVKRSTDQITWTLIATKVLADYGGDHTDPGLYELYTRYTDQDNNSDNDLFVNTTYYYKIVAHNVHGDTESPVDFVLTANTPPKGATALTATKSAVTPHNEIDLFWSDNSTNETGFKVERTGDIGGVPDETGWHEIAEAGPHPGKTDPNDPDTRVTYTDVTCQPDTTYWYRVLSHNQWPSYDGYSNNAFERTDTQPANDPPEMSRVDALSRFDIECEWSFADEASCGITKYRLEKSLQASQRGEWVEVAYIDADNSDTYTYTDSTCEPQTTYWYHVIAVVDDDNESPPSRPMSTTTEPNPSTSLWKLDVNTQFLNCADTLRMKRTFIIYNRSGHEDLHWSIMNFCPSVVSLDPSSGTIPTGSSFPVTVTTGLGGLPSDEKGYIKVCNTEYGIEDGEANIIYPDSKNIQIFMGANINDNLTILKPAPPDTVLTGQSDQIEWSDDSGAEGYYVYYSPDKGYNYCMLTNPTTDIKTLTWNLKGLLSDKTYMVLIATEDDYVVYTINTPDDYLLLTNPVNLQALVQSNPPSESEINLSWDLNSGSEEWDSFKIECYTFPAGWSLISTVDVVNDQTHYEFPHTGLINGQRYKYRVYAYKDLDGDGTGGEAYGSDENDLYSAYTDETFATPGYNTFPTEPGDLTAAHDVNNPAFQINLNWTDSEGELKYIIERKDTLTGSWSVLDGNYGQNDTVYHDTTCYPDTCYFYRVAAENNAGRVYSRTAFGRTEEMKLNLQGNGSGSDWIGLIWRDTHPALTNSYVLLRRQPGMADWSFIVELNADGGTYNGYTDDGGGLTPGTRYEYVVYSKDGSHVLGISNIDEERTVAVNTPSAPSALEASAFGYYLFPDAPADDDVHYTPNWDDIGTLEMSDGGYYFALKWQDNSDNENNFHMQYTAGGSSWNDWDYEIPEDTTIQPVPVHPAYLGSSFEFKVCAHNTAGDSAYSNISNTTISSTPPASPTNLTAIGPSPADALLTWDDNSQNEAGYKIELSENGGATWISTHQVPGILVYDYYWGIYTATGYVGCAAMHLPPSGRRGAGIFGLDPVKTYKFRVMVFNYTWNGSNYVRQLGGYSNAADVTAPTAPPDQPYNFVAEVNPDDPRHSALLYWEHDHLSGADGFRLEASYNTDTEGNYFLIADEQEIEWNWRGGRVDSLPAETAVYFRICAVNAVNPDGPYEWTYANDHAPITTAKDVPAAPHDLDATMVSPELVHLTWVPGDTDEDEFILNIACDDPGNMITQLRLAKGSVSCDIPAAYSPGAVYYFKIKARNCAGSSVWSNTDSVSVPVPETEEMRIYVDSEYTGGIREGSYDHPYVTIEEALADLSSGRTVICLGYHTTSGQATYPAAGPIVLPDNVSMEGGYEIDYREVWQQGAVRGGACDKTIVIGTIQLASNSRLKDITFTYGLTDGDMNVTQLAVTGSNAAVTDCAFYMSYEGPSPVWTNMACLNGDNITLEGNMFDMSSITDSSNILSCIAAGNAGASSNIKLLKNTLYLKSASLSSDSELYGLNADSVDGLLMENNNIIIRGDNVSYQAGVNLSPGTGHYVDNAVLKNNSILVKATATVPWMPYTPYGIYSKSPNLNVRNNIIDIEWEGGSPRGIGCKIANGEAYAENIAVTYNVFYSSATLGITAGLTGVFEDGNIKEYPFFKNIEEGDLHLLPFSPAINAGDPDDPYINEPDYPPEGRINCGSYGNTDEASRTPVTVTVPGNYYNIQDAVDSNPDIVSVSAGTYTGDITMREGVSLTGEGRAATTINGTVTGASYTLFEGFKVVDDRAGLDTAGGVVSMTIRRNSFIVTNLLQGMLQGAVLNGTNITFENNIVDVRGPGPDIAPYPEDDYAYSKLKTRSSEDSHGSSYDPVKSRGGSYGDYSVRGVLIGTDSIPTTAVCKNNTIYTESKTAAITPYSISAYAMTGGGIRNNILVSNNTCNGDEISLYVEGWAGGESMVNASYNIYYKPHDMWQPLVYDGSQGNMVVIGASENTPDDPLFEDEDYHLSIESPAVDGGDPHDDYANEPEPNGEGIECGAYGNTGDAARTPIRVPEDYYLIEDALLAAVPGATIVITDENGPYIISAGLLTLPPDISLIGKGDVEVNSRIQVSSNSLIQGINFIRNMSTEYEGAILDVNGDNVTVKDCGFVVNYNYNHYLISNTSMALIDGDNITLEGNEFIFILNTAQNCGGVTAVRIGGRTGVYWCGLIAIGNRIEMTAVLPQDTSYLYGMFVDEGDWIFVENNIISLKVGESNYSSQIGLWFYGGAFERCTVKNNTVFIQDYGTQNDGLPYTGIYNQGVYKMNIRNNIVDMLGEDGVLAEGTAVKIVQGTVPAYDISVAYNICNAGQMIDVTPLDMSGVVQHDNIGADPLFVNGPYGDFHLEWDSPAIDGGYTADNYSLEPAPNGGRINCGNYGNTPEATATSDELLVSPYYYD